MASVRKWLWRLGAFSLAIPAFFASASNDSGRRLSNPLRVDSFPQLIRAILDIVVQIGAPVAALFLIYSGFLFVFARGNEDKLKKAKRSLTWTLVGTALLLGAWVLSQAIGTTIEELVR